MKKIAIVYGSAEGIQKHALEQLTETLLDCMVEYPSCFAAADAPSEEDFRCIYIGTRENNAFLKDLPGEPLTEPESYHILVTDDKAFIEGFDDAGVLYGCVDFYCRYIVSHEYVNASENHFVNVLALEKMPLFELVSAPSIKHRGLWTWGHVIYDYKGYLDNMAKLKMNEVIIWNDFAPVNGADIVAYAHERNIKVIWGYSWFWDTNCAAIDVNAALENAASVLEQYEREYRHLGGDGIYFQSFTELSSDNIGGICIAEAVTMLVNKAAAMFFEKYPDLELQFGLHADSVREKLNFIAGTDPRVRIVWENCGAFPFSYLPDDVEGFDDTCRFVRDICHLRGKDERFGAVTKGLVKLDWAAFEHPKGPYCIGISSKDMQKNRIERKRKVWKYIQAYWMAYAEYAEKMVKLVRQETGGNTHITALVEDGMFERQIMFPAALYAEMLWNCERETKELLSEVALRSYVEFA
ncbi:MAG: hypothetical protein IJD13_03900 [Oscillospiraceae bacterium]|nr:hypothetical protein [Oscillospiraceae bacterium]